MNMIRGLILFAAGAALASTAGWMAVPRLLYRQQSQPVAFSHKVHNEKGGMACNDCHSLREDGSFAGIPKVAKCAECHSAPMGETKAEAEFVANYVTPNREPQWLVYARQPDNAWFPHGAHLKRANLACEKCHGGQGKSDKLPLFEVNRISGYSRDVMGRAGNNSGMRMDSCLRCHEQRGLRHACLDCHK
jgi:hypothetical protein